MLGGDLTFGKLEIQHRWTLVSVILFVKRVIEQGCMAMQRIVEP
jgi:hypothetical protein